jgi:hypothetical protein
VLTRQGAPSDPVGVTGFEPATSSSRSKDPVPATSLSVQVRGPAVSVDVRGCARPFGPIVTQLVTHWVVEKQQVDALARPPPGRAAQPACAAQLAGTGRGQHRAACRRTTSRCRCWRRSDGQPSDVRHVGTPPLLPGPALVRLASSPHRPPTRRRRAWPPTSANRSLRPLPSQATRFDATSLLASHAGGGAARRGCSRHRPGSVGDDPLLDGRSPRTLSRSANQRPEVSGAEQARFDY